MPRVPTAGTTAERIPFTSPNSITGTLNAFQSITDVINQQADRSNRKENEKNERIRIAKGELDKARQTDLFIEKSSELTRGLTKIQSDSKSPEEFLEKADAFLREIRGGLDDAGEDVVSLRIAGTGTNAIDSTNATMVARQAREQRAGAREFLANDTLPLFAESAARAKIAGNDVEVDRLVSQVAGFIQENSHFTEEEKVGLFLDFSSRQESDEINLLLEQALAEPGNAEESLIKADVLLDKEFTPNISAKSRLVLRRSLRTAKDAIKTSNAARDKAINAAVIDDFTLRLKDVDPANNPTITEVVSSDLSRIEQDHFIALIEDSNNGVDVSSGIPSVENEILAAIYDETSPNHISDPAQLVPFLGRIGLGIDAFKSFTSTIEKLNSAEERIPEKQFGDFISSVTSAIVNPSEIPFSDPQGESLFNDFRIAARILFDEGRAEGIPIEVLLSRAGDNPKSIARIIPNFQRSQLEKTTEAFKLFDPNPEDDNTNRPVFKRKAGESASSYLERRAESLAGAQ